MIKSKFSLQAITKKTQKRVLISGAISSIAIAAFLGFSPSNTEISSSKEKPSLEESLRLEGEVIAFHAVKHSVHQSALTALQNATIAFNTESVSPELAEWKGHAVDIAGTIESKQSVFDALNARKINAGSIQGVVVATNTAINFRKKSRPGDHWSAKVDKDGKIESFRYQTSPEHIWETQRDEKGDYHVEKVGVDVDKRKRVATGKIKSSLWKALADSSAGSEYVADFIDLFAYKFDFGTQTKAGDEFSMVFEEVYLDGKFLRYGDVLAASYKTYTGTEFFAFRYEHDSKIAYYDEKGDSLKGQFLKSPIADARITSIFGKRFHPILKTMKTHQGVDYGAPTGTSIQAIASGTILYAGWRGSYGKLISIQHADGYVTRYAHLSRIKPGLKKGAKVTQKTVIGYVGSTGRSTGPHLHLEMIKNGKHINPLSVKLVKEERLMTAVLKKYKSSVVLPMMKQLRNVVASDLDG